MTNENRVALKMDLINKSKMTQNDIAKEVGMTKQTINDIIWGRNNNKKLIRKVVDLIGFDFTKYHM